MDKTEKRLWAVGVAVILYFLLSIMMGFPILLTHPQPREIFALLPQFWYLKLPISLAAAMLSMLLVGYDLNGISAKKVGQGQHGTARWATEQEKHTAYAKVRFGCETVIGFVVGFEKGCWLVDTSDASGMLVAPPGAGKTKRLFIPSIFYNAMVNLHTKGKGASMILTDCKGELLKSCGTFLKACGYRVLFLNFSEPLTSYRFNLLNGINRHIDCYKAAPDDDGRRLHYGRAERYAKILASSIVDNMGDAQKSDSGSYFTETSKGLLTGMILLVSEYGEAGERHIISVFRLIIELNGLTEDSSQTHTLLIHTLIIYEKAFFFYSNKVCVT